ncbi:MAG: hypothetical protein A2Z21_00820 [Candidatus Fraserbacteria bacterium RBG_16_55_9]|uniref:Crp/Fnr family transcriptional regulator n=1 Tax=Fraserbacteria sp. (strain RBG_16_55_9) TaxID=1817864 RepID=A0A1F5UXP7_FRAXR|nr:MAG: hypothetical protein A2Z21_00820 [Candidatus Fraserbacteria bacterium RBG_16_55_9]
MEIAMKNCMSCERSASCILGRLPETELREISKRVKSLYYVRGQVIWQEGVYRPGCFILCQGRALLTVRKSGEAKRRILKFLQTGDLIPCVNASHNGERIYNDFVVQVEAETPALVYYLPASSFRSFVMRHPSVATKVIERLSVVARELLHEIWISSYCDVRARVARVLMELQGAAQFERQPLLRQVIADLVGVNRKVTNKALYNLMEEKIIAIQDHKIEVLDERRLRELQV